MITLAIGLVVFLIYLTSSIGLTTLQTYSFENNLFFTGGISKIFSNFTVLIIILIMALAFVIVIVISSTLILNKKKDIAVMKALGSLPKKIYNFYLTEVYFMFFIAFLLGIILGLLSYGIVVVILLFNGVPIFFQFDLFFIPILFFSCLGGIFIVPGYIIRKIGNQKIVKTLSKDIPYNFDASKPLTFIPRWLSLIGFNFKISVINTLRRKGEFKRYLIVFSIISLIIFTLALGVFLLSTSSQEWVRKSQGENIIVIGHREVVEKYALMYSMFSDPDLSINYSGLDLLESEFLFNFSDIEDLNNISEVERIDQRLINFFGAEELDGYHYYENGGYNIVGQRRTGTFPIVGVNITEILQDFEIEGSYFTSSDSFMNMFIGDGLAYNFFDYAFDQSLRITETGHNFHISGVVIDTFFSGYAGYIDLQILQEDLNLTNQEINLALIKIKPNSFDRIKDELETIIIDNLGANFTSIQLDPYFSQNLHFVLNLTLYPFLLIIAMAIVSLLSLYNYQKGGIMDKAKDFLIMRAIGSKNRLIKRILFLEASYVIIPSISLSLGIGMILNSVFLFERVTLPDLSVPFIIIGIQFMFFLLFNYLSLFPIIKKVKAFKIKDFNIY